MIHLLLFPFGCGNLGTQAFLSMIRERERERERWGEEGGGVEANRPSKNKGV
jgi:hypothetical protein